MQRPGGFPLLPSKTCLGRSASSSLPRSKAQSLLPAICEQKVTGCEARAAFQGIVRAYGRPAPGPGGLRLPPEPAELAAQPYFAFHRFGLEQRRAEVLRRAAEFAGKRVEGLETLESQLAMFTRLPAPPRAAAPRPGSPVEMDGQMQNLSKAMSDMHATNPLTGDTLPGFVAMADPVE